LKVLFATSSHRDLQNPKHGAERQLYGQARALSERGHDVEVDNINWNAPDIKDFDIIQMVNSNGPNGSHQSLANHAIDKGVPVVSTPTFWPPNDIIDQSDEQQKQQIDLHIKTLLPWLSASTHLTPNADVEADKLKGFLDTFNYTVIRNAVDKQEIAEVQKNEVGAPDEWGDYVLCVGRMEPRKNQWRLIHAMQALWQDDVDAKLVMIGKANRDYLRKFSSSIERYEDRVVIDPQIKDPKTVLNAIKNARVLAMPSLLETPGLVALEAAALGTSLAITGKGSTKEYFNGYAHYCDPTRVDSIGYAVRDAWKENGFEESERFIEKYNYENEAEKLESLYQNILGG